MWHLKLLATSCRVVSCGTGTLLLRWLADRAARAGAHLTADLRRTARNRTMVVAHQFAGFDRRRCPRADDLAPAPDDSGIHRLHLLPRTQAPPKDIRLAAPAL